MSESLVALTLEKLNQLSKKELVRMLLAQQKVIEKLQQEIEKLKISRYLDSKSFSKPPSTDILSKVRKSKKL